MPLEGIDASWSIVYVIIALNYVKALYWRKTDKSHSFD